MSCADKLAKYRIQRELAEGRSGAVDLAVTARGSPVVVKKMSKEKSQLQWVQNEVRAGELLRDVKGIVRFREHFEDDKHHYVVVDYAKGEDLFAFMQRREFKPLKERYARNIIRQLTKSLLHCHEQGISHKDIKLENICVDKNQRTTLIDFGFCEFTTLGHISTRYDGTPEYASPEILLNVPFSTQKADVYSLGVVLYTLVTGMFPFDFKERCRMLESGGKPRVDWKHRNNAIVSLSLRQLIDSMLETDPQARISLTQVTEHKWMKKKDWLSMLGI